MGRVKPRSSRSADKEDRIRRAIEERAAHGSTLRELSLKYGVPRSTLSDRLRRIQQAMELTPLQEKALAKWFEQLEETGLPPRPDLFKAKAMQLAQKRAEDEEDPSLAKLRPNWDLDFFMRHPDLCDKYLEANQGDSKLASQPGPIRQYFRTLERLLKEHKFKSENMYNVDEKGFMLSDGTRAARRGRKTSTETQDASGEFFTVIETCSGDNTMLPPMIIYKGQEPHHGWSEVDVDIDSRKVFAHSDKGHSNEELALRWLQDYFDPWTRGRANGEPRLLIIEGHCRHYGLEFIQYARQNNIILVSVPDHSANLLQPLTEDVVCSSVNKAYGDAVLACRTGVSITKADFWKLYTSARQEAYTQENIESAWRGTGISPYNPDAVLEPLAKMIDFEARKPVLKLEKAAEIYSPRTFLALKTPKNAQELRYQIEQARNLIPQASPSTQTAIAGKLLPRLIKAREATRVRFEKASAEKKELLAGCEKEFQEKGLQETDLVDFACETAMKRSVKGKGKTTTPSTPPKVYAPSCPLPKTANFART
jgi:hypothetical protein